MKTGCFRKSKKLIDRRLIIFFILFKCCVIMLAIIAIAICVPYYIQCDLNIHEDKRTPRPR